MKVLIYNWILFITVYFDVIKSKLERINGEKYLYLVHFANTNMILLKRNTDMILILRILIPSFLKLSLS